MTNVTAIDRMVLERMDLTPMHRSSRRWNAVLFVSMLFGAAFFLGCLAIGLLTAGEFIAPSTSLYAASTILIGGSFILFGLAAHCLDKINASEKAIRLEYCRQHGLMDED